MSSDADDQGLAMSSGDSKTRMKWTRQLHQSFVDAVSQLGGADKATPKSVMRVMGVPGITLYHLKSHLQKYRLAKSRDHRAISTHEDIVTADYRPIEGVMPCAEMNDTQPQFHCSRAMLQLQLEVRRRLQEQIEVQRHLQVRIEAQGKYLQSVLRKAQETLASYSLNSAGMEAARAELSELVSAVDMEYPSSSFSQATSVPRQMLIGAACSTDSCLTSSEMPKQRNPVASDGSNNWTAESDETNLRCSEKNETESGKMAEGGERIRCNGRSIGFTEEIDLNR